MNDDEMKFLEPSSSNFTKLTISIAYPLNKDVCYFTTYYFLDIYIDLSS